MATAAPCAPAEARVKLMCSHGGRFVPCGPGGAIRYVGGETRVLAVPRAAAASRFRDLAARLSSEIAGGADVRAIRYRLADDEGVVVSATCDEELAHMLDEYDRLRATRPSTVFRVFVATSRGGERRGLGSRPGARQRRSDLLDVHLQPCTSKNSNGVRSRGQQPSPAVSSAAKVRPSSRDANVRCLGVEFE